MKLGRQRLHFHPTVQGDGSVNNFSLFNSVVWYGISGPVPPYQDRFQSSIRFTLSLRTRSLPGRVLGCSLPTYSCYLYIVLNTASTRICTTFVKMQGNRVRNKPPYLVISVYTHGPDEAKEVTAPASQLRCARFQRNKMRKRR